MPGSSEKRTPVNKVLKVVLLANFQKNIKQIQFSQLTFSQKGLTFFAMIYRGKFHVQMPLLRIFTSVSLMSVELVPFV